MEFTLAMQGLRFLVADPPEQRRDFETKAPKTTDDGTPIFQAKLLAMDGKSSAPIRVSLEGDPGMVQGQFVRPVRLVLHAIDRRGDSVMWWTAERLEPEPMPGAGASGKAGGSGGKAAGQ